MLSMAIWQSLLDRVQDTSFIELELAEAHLSWNPSQATASSLVQVVHCFAIFMGIQFLCSTFI
jgi:hypothetical protein